MSAFGGKADISARIDHGYGSTGGAYGHPTRLAAKCVWSPERLATTTPRTTVASVRCRSRTPPTRRLTTLQMAVTAITLLCILTLKLSFRDVLHIIRSQSAGCYLCLQSSKQRRRSCIAASLWQSLHLRSSVFLPRRASRPPAAEAANPCSR